MCALDLTKAFDKMNHHGLFIKLMDKRIPVMLLRVIEHWFSIGNTCVKWGTYFSQSFKLLCGVRQGGVLSPYLFAVYIDSVYQNFRRLQPRELDAISKGYVLALILINGTLCISTPASVRRL